MIVADADAKEIFLQALDFDTAAEQSSFVESACQHDTELRARVEALLRAHLEAGRFLGGARPDSAPPPAEVAGHPIGPYTLVRELGAGGMGVVWLAEQAEPVRRRVALKVIRPGLDSAQVIARFAAEREALALMDHPNIARVLDAGTTAAGSPYFVMELVEGAPITKFCDERRLTILERLKLFIAVCHAVQHAHQKGVIHRDIKPSNVLVAEFDGQPTPKVIDFGIAKAIGEESLGQTRCTLQGQIIGTPEYMAPEQAEFNPSDVDTRCDIYALGVLLYELLTGTTPFDRGRVAAANLSELLRTIKEVEPQSLSACLPGDITLETTASHRNTDPARLRKLLRGDLDWIVLKCLEKSRSRRYASAGSLADDIRRHLDGSPVEAHRPSRWYQAQKFVSRNRLAVLTSAAIVALLVGGLVATSLLLHREKLAYDHTRRLLYCADMNLALDAWRVNNRPQLLALLRRHVPRGIEPDLRGFEWYHLWELSQRHQTQIVSLPYKPSMLTVSPDGKQFAVGLLDGTVQVYDFRSWKKLASYGKKIPGTFFRTWVAYTHDGSCLVYQNGSKAIVVDLQSGDENPLPADGEILCLAISADDQLLALGIRGGKVELWDLAKRERIKVLSPNPLRVVQTVAFSQEGHSLVAGGDGRSPRLWDDVREAKWPRVLNAIRSWDMGPRFAPDGQTLACLGGKSVNLWRVSNVSQIHQLQHRPEDIAGYAYSPDGRQLVVGTREGRLHLWNTQNGAKLSTQPAHAGTANCVAFSPDGKFILSAGGDRAVCLWNAALPVEQDALLIQMGTRFANVTSSGYLVTLNENEDRPPRRLRMWNIHSRDEIPLSFPGQDLVEQMAVSPRGRIAAWVPGDQILLLDDLGKRQSGLPKPAGQTARLTALAISPDEQLLLSGHQDGRVVVWDLATGTEISAPPPQPGLIHALRFTTNASILAISHANRVALYRRSIANGEIAWTALKDWEHPAGDASAVLALQFHTSDDGLLAMGSQNGEVYLWQWQTNQPPRVFSGHTEAALGIAFSPDGMSLVSGGADRAVIFWDLVTGQQRMRLLQDNPLIGRGMVFSADGQTLISSDRAWRLYFWHAASKEQVAEAEW